MYQASITYYSEDGMLDALDSTKYAFEPIRDVAYKTSESTIYLYSKDLNEIKHAIQVMTEDEDSVDFVEEPVAGKMAPGAMYFKESRMGRRLHESAWGGNGPLCYIYGKMDGQSTFKGMDVNEGIFVDRLFYASIVRDDPEGEVREKLQKLADMNKDVHLVLQLRDGDGGRVVFQTELNESRRPHGRRLFEDTDLFGGPTRTNPFEVGDILAGTWGYSMTIPMFVQVVGVTPKSVRCRQLRVLNDNGFQGHDAMARKNDFKPESRNFPNTFLARVKGEPGEEYVMCPSPTCYLKLWDGRGLTYDHMD